MNVSFLIPLESLHFNLYNSSYLSLKTVIYMLFLFFFFFSCHRCIERYECYLSNTTGITSFQPLQLKFCVKHRSNVKSIIIQPRLEHDLNFIFKLLIFRSYFQKYLQNIKQKISRYFIYKTWVKY
jgi:hypothetical protein